MLNNFYYDNGSESQIFDAFINIKQSVYDEMTKYTKQIGRNFILGEVETYRIIDTQIIPIGEATYNLVEMLSISSVSMLLGIEGLSIEEKIIAWNALDTNSPNKIAVLNSVGAYIDLTTDTMYFTGEDIPLPAATVISMDMYDGDTKFQIGIDYDIQNSRLYLLSERCYSKDRNSNKAFTCRCIAIDMDTTNRYFGKNFNLPKYADFSKDVLNDMLANLTRAALSGPSIKGIRDGIDIVTGVQDSSIIYDKYSINNKKSAEWDNYNLTPFDFIVEIPASHISSESLSDIITRYIDVVKLSDSHYRIVYNSSYEDDYSRHINADDEFDLSVKFSHEENYMYKIALNQTNNTAYRLNQNFSTEFTRGYSKNDIAFVKITNTQTLEETIVSL